ncbi:alpha/beta fold hydrolase [Nocardioides mangrovi]|uniref:Alpha/beta hydrolase n=1 Tax=Nocardioides mangrovi TaxID=2874580 RepID=A0ABS7U9Q1_9ACTN|nr:alpha/beta hydrolase [Nocardioides mangrovi]MBZ5737703.1 alpha/beta hydrolase [Nocardioides mangrovi]
MSEVLEIPAPGHRTLEVLVSGDPIGLPLLYHAGSPSAVVDFPPLQDAAERAGMRLITHSRAGYGGSSPKPMPTTGPLIVDDLGDLTAILDHFDIGAFVTLGWAGGGPRALLCAATMADRCLSASTVASVAPVDGAGLDWVAGMVPANVAELAAAAQGARAYAAYLAREFAPFLDATAEMVAESMYGAVTAVDRPMVTPEYAAFLAATFRRSAIQGVTGARDDGLAIMSRWGFDLDEIAVPVSIWHGVADAMVPFAHGAWLADHVPGARHHLLPDDGHLTMLGRLDEILADLRDLAGLR